MSAADRPRLDQYLVELGLVETRSQAQALILAGRVVVDDKRADKAGLRIKGQPNVRLKDRETAYVSRGGDKLAGALDSFQINPMGWRCLDVGISTGGFTDCLLQRGAAHVTGVDVGYGQTHNRLREDPRVRLLERVNFRNLDLSELGDPFDFFVMDVSFISVEKLLPRLRDCLLPDGRGVVLLKPQFEAGPADVGKGGIVRQPSVHERVIENFLRFCYADVGFQCRELIPSPIRGREGNVEYLADVSFPQGNVPLQAPAFTGIAALVADAFQGRTRGDE